MEIRAMTEPEWLYSCSLSSRLTNQTSQVGVFDGNVDNTNSDLRISWTDKRDDMKPDDFDTMLKDVLDKLSKNGALLHNKSSMARFARNFPGASWSKTLRTRYGFRIDAGEYAFLLHCCLSKPRFRFECACYIGKSLDHQIKEAEQGIQFITPEYKEIFRIPDGGKILVTKPDGTTIDYACRYVDACHFEAGIQFFHIYEFAERMKRAGWRCEPKPVPYNEQKKEYAEIISRILIKKDGVYLSSHSACDGEPFRSWRNEELSEAYAAGGKTGLDRAVIEMLCSGANLHGPHPSLARYRYALLSDAGREIDAKYDGAIQERYMDMSDADRITLYCHPNRKAQRYIDFEREMLAKMYTELADRCAEYDRKFNPRGRER